MHRYYIAYYKGETDPAFFGLTKSPDPEADDEGAKAVAQAFGEEEYEKPLVKLLRVTGTKEVPLF